MATPIVSERAQTAQEHHLPTIMLVQGSFQIPQVYDKLVEGLEALGYPTSHPSLPSCCDSDRPSFPQISLVDDVLAVRSELIRQIEYEEKVVIVVMHSYGGLVGSEAVTEDLSYAVRQKQGLPGGVIHLFYYAAFLLDKDQSVMDVFGESPNNDVKDGRMRILRGEQTLYNDLSPAEASSWTSRLVAQSHRVQTTKLKRTAAWHYIQSTYLVCENDQAAPPSYQEMFAAKAQAYIERCNSGHSPQLSQPEMLVRKIHEASQRAISEFSKGV